MVSPGYALNKEWRAWTRYRWTKTPHRPQRQPTKKVEVTGDSGRSVVTQATAESEELHGRQG